MRLAQDGLQVCDLAGGDLEGLQGGRDNRHGDSTSIFVLSQMLDCCHEGRGFLFFH